MDRRQTLKLMGGAAALAGTGFPGFGRLAATLFSEETTNRDRRELDRMIPQKAVRRSTTKQKVVITLERLDPNGERARLERCQQRPRLWLDGTRARYWIGYVGRARYSARGRAELRAGRPRSPKSNAQRC